MPKTFFKLALLSFLAVISISIISTSVYAVDNDSVVQQNNYSEQSIETKKIDNQSIIVVPEAEKVAQLQTEITQNNTTAFQEQPTVKPEPSTLVNQHSSQDRQPIKVTNENNDKSGSIKNSLTISIDDVYTTNHYPVIAGYVSDNNAIITIEVYSKEYQATIRDHRFTLENTRLIPNGIYGNFTVKISAKNDEQKIIKTIVLHLSPSPSINTKRVALHPTSNSSGLTVYSYSSTENRDGKMSSSSDLDGDGYSDKTEKLAGTDPKDASNNLGNKGETSSQKTEKPNQNDTKNAEKTVDNRSQNIQWILIGTAATAFLAFILRDQSNNE